MILEYFIVSGNYDIFQINKMLFVIITDGYENTGRCYTAPQIKELIEHEQSKYGWEFIFPRVNIDAVKNAAGFGIRADRASNYVRR